MYRRTFKLFVFSLLFIGTCIHSIAQTTPPDKPKLIVLVIVEQMRYEYLERFSAHFSSGGFKKITTSGVNCVDAHVNFSYGQSASGFASIATGTTPSNHGIIGNSWYNRKTKSRVNCVSDDHYLSIGVDAHDEYQVSAKQLLASTYGDELLSQSFGRYRSYSISLDQHAAVLCAGHWSDGVYWLDEYSGDWMSGTYYNNTLPAWLNAFNNKGLANMYANRTWNTFLPMPKYKESTRDDAKYEIGIRNQHTFPYLLPKLQDPYKPYKILKCTPYGNTYTKDMAIELIEKEQLGKRQSIDFLTIAYTATEEIGNRFGCLSKEIEDTYIRLDFELMFFLNYLETHVGKENFLFVLTSNHGMSISPKCETQKSMRLGTFKPVETMYLIDKHLDVTFGEDNWIEHYQDLQIYLNTNTIKKRNLTVAEVEDDCCEFITQLAGIQSAIGSVWLADHNFCTNQIFKMVDNSYNIERSANIFMTLKPGWGEQTVESVGSHISPYNYDTHVPLLWYGWKMEPKIVKQPIEITDIIVTLSEITRTARPNMANGKVIDYLFR